MASTAAPISPRRRAYSTDTSFFGHPRGLAVLFATEMWERFSYYGMRALLIFYLTQHFLFGTEQAYLLYGAYTALVYVTPVIGGALADRYLGARKAVILGAVLLVIGHAGMAIEGEPATRTAAGVLRDPFYVSTFYASLAFIITGVGFLKANVSTIVGMLYAPADLRRDGAYTIFYMGINLGAALGALIAGYLGQTWGWAWGFGAAGVGMLLGLLVFIGGRPLLEGHGEPLDPARLKARVGPLSLEWTIYLGSLGGVLVVWQLIQYQALVGTLLGLAGAATVAWIVYTSVRHLEPNERDRTFLALILMGFSILFWALFEQAGSSLNIYADQRVDRSFMGMTIPASMFQSLNSIYIILLGPIFAALWVWLGRNGWEPSTPAKFGLGLVLLGIGFLVLVWGAASGTALTPLVFLFLIYFFHTAGELCLSPVGLSAMTKLAVPRMVGLIMGTWFLASAAGNFTSGLIARATGGGEGLAMSSVLEVYSTVGWYAVAAGAAVIVAAPLLKRLAHQPAAGDLDQQLEGEHELGEPAAAGIRPEPHV